MGIEKIKAVLEQIDKDIQNFYQKHGNIETTTEKTIPDTPGQTWSIHDPESSTTSSLETKSIGSLLQND